MNADRSPVSGMAASSVGLAGAPRTGRKRVRRWLAISFVTLGLIAVAWEVSLRILMKDEMIEFFFRADDWSSEDDVVPRGDPRLPSENPHDKRTSVFGWIVICSQATRPGLFEQCMKGKGLTSAGDGRWSWIGRINDRECTSETMFRVQDRFLGPRLVVGMAPGRSVEQLRSDGVRIACKLSDY